MKKETKLKKKRASIKEWLAKARDDLQPGFLQGKHGEFYLLVAVEQILVYLEEESI